MCTSQASDAKEQDVDDRNTRARIRDAAIECIARDGLDSLTARSVAASAGVSAGSVIHHFGSMDGLRVACDEHVAAVIRRYESEAMSAGPTLDVLAVLRGGDIGWTTAYLAAVLADDSPIVARLVDDLLFGAEGYMALGVESGMLRPTDNPRGRAGVVLMWSLGALVLHRHVERIFGFDITDSNLVDTPALAAYLGPFYEIMGEGILTEPFQATLKEALAATPDASGGQPAASRTEAIPATPSTSEESK
jgi:AcrR family transcriptional regulator